MKKSKKRVIAFLLAVFCVVGMVQVPAKAATKPVMKSVNMKWDLKNDKSLTYKKAIYQMDKNGKKLKNLVKEDKLKLTDYKVSEMKNGKKKLTFKVVFSFAAKYSKKEVDQINYFWETDEDEGNHFYIAVVDYETGECLSAKNKKGVEVKYGNWKESEMSKEYFGHKDLYMYMLPLKMSCEVTVTYPADYKNLCILAGGCSEPVGKCSKLKGKSKSDFWAGDINFKQADGMYSKTDKMFCHGMRVK